MIIVVPLALGFLLYLAPIRRGPALIIWISSVLLATLFLFAIYFFHPHIFYRGILHASFWGSTFRAFTVRGVYREVALQILRACPPLALLLPTAVFTYILWRRTRYFGNTAPGARRSSLHRPRHGPPPHRRRRIPHRRPPTSPDLRLRHPRRPHGNFPAQPRHRHRLGPHPRLRPLEPPILIPTPPRVERGVRLPMWSGHSCPLAADRESPREGHDFSRAETVNIKMRLQHLRHLAPTSYAVLATRNSGLGTRDSTRFNALYMTKYLTIFQTEATLSP